MANTIPCPNPTCVHQFTLAELQSAAQLLCPKCGFRMVGKGTAKSTPPAPKSAPAAAKPISVPVPKPAAPITVPNIARTAPAKAMPISVPAPPAMAQPVAKPAPNPPMAMPIPAPPAAPAPTLAVAVPEPAPSVSSDGSLSEGTFFNPEVAAAGPLVRTNVTRRPWNWMRVLITLLSVGIAVFFVVIVIGLFVWFLPALPGVSEMFGATGDQYVGKIRNARGDHEKVYKLALPRTEWGIDANIKSRFSAETAWQSKEYDFWFALVVKDYGMQKPRDAEMLRIAIDRLEGHFGEDMELGAKAEPAKFADLPAQKLRFRGVLNTAKWEGECHMFFKNGVAYWLFLASPDIGTVAFFADELPDKHLFVISDRRGWREQPVPTITYVSAENKIDVTAPEKVWEKSIDPKVDDENGILLLVGRRDKDNRKNAHILAFTAKKEGDLKATLKSARDALETREKSANDNYKILLADEAGKADFGVGADVGTKRGRLIELKLMHGDEPQPLRYYMLAVVQEADVVYGIVADCDWRSRSMWRQDFLDMLRTFRVK